MKKFIFLFLALLIVSHAANAQYKINKTRYDYRTYTYQKGDRYKPGNAGIISFFLYPGLGHMYAGEKSRGWAFFGANFGCIMLTIYPVFTQTTGKASHPAGNDNTYDVLSTIGGAGMVILRIWSTVDAVRVAKVNNLASREMDKTTFEFKIRPFVSDVNYLYTSKYTSGLSLQFVF